MENGMDNFIDKAKELINQAKDEIIEKNIVEINKFQQ